MNSYDIYGIVILKLFSNFRNEGVQATANKKPRYPPKPLL